MGKPVKKASSPEQPESSRSRGVRKSLQRGSGEKLVDVKGKAKFKAYSHQPNKGAEKRKVGINRVNSDQKIQRGEFMGKLRRQFHDLKNTNEELVKMNKRLKSAVTALEQQIERVKNFMQENSSMHVDTPKGKTDALITCTCPKEGLATNKLITQGTGTSQTEVPESDIKQIQVKVKEIRANNKQLKMDNERLNSKLADLALLFPSSFPEIDDEILSACCNEELTAGRGATEGALKLKRKSEDELNKVGKRKLPKAVDDTSSSFKSSIRWLICKFATQLATVLVTRLATALVNQFANALVTPSHLFSTAEVAESREARHDKQASTLASGIKGTTDVLNLEKVNPPN